MEINHKRGGFMRRRLMMPLQAARASTRVQHSTNKLMDSKRSQTAPPPASVVYLDPGVTYMDNSVREKKLSQLADRLFGVTVDEGVDAKAASYISAVRERFMHETVQA